LKISLHSDVLIELAGNSGQSGNDQSPIMALLERDDIDCWAPAMCIADAYRALHVDQGIDVARNLLEIVRDRISSVPLRSGTFIECLESENESLESCAHRSVDNLIGIDAVVSQSLDSSQAGGLRCLTPEQVLAMEPGARVSKVPFLDLKAQFPKIYNEIDDRITGIMSNTGFILGPHVEEFERAFAAAQGAKHCIGVSSGTDALHLALMALNIGPGDKVIVPANTFIATAEAVSLAGATPVFVDSNEYYNIDIDATRRLLEGSESTDNIRAVIPVHLYGQPADLDGIAAIAEEFNLTVIEDAAQAHLATYDGKCVGTNGAFGAFSFYPGKNLGAYGEAGALITNDDTLYEKAKMLRAHGEATRYFHSAVGHNYRMEAIQGAVLATKMKYLADWTEGRRRNAKLYKQFLADVPQVQLPAEIDAATSSYHLFVIQVDDRDSLRESLDREGIASGLHYPLPLHLQEAYKGLGYREGDFPNAEAQSDRILSLPMYPELTKSQIEHVCITIKNHLNAD
jgi:dTDP-4-amino-4,6-dideoxygalactose transaminase